MTLEIFNCRHLIKGNFILLDETGLTSLLIINCIQIKCRGDTSNLKEKVLPFFDEQKEKIGLT